MAVYIYETTAPEIPAEQFELRQSMLDEPLTTHPETGVAIRRVISGGFGFSIRGGARQTKSSPSPQGHCCGGGCGCH